MLAISSYTFFKFLHVLLAIIAVGFNATYGILLGRAAREPEHERHVLRTVRVLDSWFANPAYVLLLVTGLLMVWVGDVDMSAFWLSTSLGIFGFVVLLGLFVYSPTLRKQLATLEADGPESAEYRSLSKRGTIVGIVLAVSVIVIVFLMVTKPTL